MTYDEIKAKCLKEGKLFEDPDFDAVDSILYYDSPTAKRYVWQRPKVITVFSFAYTLGVPSRNILYAFRLWPNAFLVPL